jgi:glutathione S-transferase
MFDTALMRKSMQLYYAETIHARKVCAVAKYLGSPVEFVRVDLTKGEQRKPDYLAMNPNGQVPLLRDGDRLLWESVAIMCHLSDEAGAELWPHDGRQIEVMRWLLWDANHFTRHTQRFYFENIVKPAALNAQPDSAELAEALKFFRVFAAILDNHLRDRSYVVGDMPTIADFALSCALPYAERAQIPLEGFDAIDRWHKKLAAIDAWRDAYPRELAEVSSR